MKLHSASVIALWYIVATSTVIRDQLDVMILQDTSGAFEEGLREGYKQLGKIHSESSQIRARTRLGVAEFKDKPFFPLGSPTDFCYRLAGSGLSDSLADLQSAYDSLIATQGGDEKQAHFQALIDLALDPQVGWRPGADHLIVLVTNSQPHLPGDVKGLDSQRWTNLPADLPANAGAISNFSDINYDCLHADYPAPKQVADALRKADIALLILTPNDPDIYAAWKWVNEDLLEQPPRMHAFVASDLKDFGEVLVAGLTFLQQS